jgi:hypothetical protein
VCDLFVMRVAGNTISHIGAEDLSGALRLLTGLQMLSLGCTWLRCFFDEGVIRIAG